VQPGIDVVFLTGVATKLTVEQTAPHATDPGQTEYPVIDCMAAPTADVHPATLANMEPATRGLLTVAEALAAGTAASTMKEASWAS
jgi:nicotinamidase-related amidase